MNQNFDNLTSFWGESFDGPDFSVLQQCPFFYRDPSINVWAGHYYVITKNKEYFLETFWLIGKIVRATDYFLELVD